MNNYDLDKAIEFEIERGNQLIIKNLETLNDLNHLLKKFKLYRNSKKFYKIQFEDYDSDKEDEDDDDEDLKLKTNLMNSNIANTENPKFYLDIIASKMSNDEDIIESDNSKLNTPIYINSALLMEKVYKRKIPQLNFLP